MNATPESAEEKPRRPPRSMPLRDCRDARRLLAKLVNEVRAGAIDPRRASCIGYLVNTFISAASAADFEARIAVLEDRHANSRN